MLQFNPLNDKAFLLELDKHREREVYARIISLDFNERPIAQIEGVVTSGSINIDGASAIRRTCSLSLVSNNFDINDYYWGLKSKFKLEIGLKNLIKDKTTENGISWGELYPQDIIWFPQGIYLISSFNTSQTVNSCVISISGKDKMCLLNGDLGGNLTASIDFGTEEYYDTETQETIYTKVPVETIIKEAVHTYAQEPYYNIVINDLDDSGVELLEYRGNTPLYLFYNIKDGRYDNYTINEKMEIYNIKNKYKDGSEIELFSEQTGISNLEKYCENIENGNFGAYLTRVDLSDEYERNYTTIFTLAANQEPYYAAAKVEYGQTVGYRQTDLVYAGDLISTIGESLTSILDKIKAMLGDFEYFYDLNGRFIFQKKKTYTQTVWNNLVKDDSEQYALNAKDSSAVIYHFEDNNMVTSFSNNPVLNNLKNDYSIWGQRITANEAEVPIHYRCAIDIKPTYYVSLPIDINDKYIIEHNLRLERDGIKPLESREKVLYCVDSYLPNDENGTNNISQIYRVDWREIIYQMALDYYKLGQLDDFISRLRENNPVLCQNYKTGYEQYYIDLQGFWRQLYDIDPQPEYDIITVPDEEQFVYEDSAGALYIKDKWIALNYDYVKNQLAANNFDSIYCLKNIKSEDGSVLRQEFDTWLNSIVLKKDKFFLKVNETIEKITKENIEQYLSLKKDFVYIASGKKEDYDQGINILKWDLEYHKGNEEYYFLKEENKTPKKITEIVETIYNDGIATNEIKEKVAMLYYKDKKYFKNLYVTQIDYFDGTPIVDEKNNILQTEKPIIYYKQYYLYYQENEKYPFWAKDVYEQPDALNFWFDFLDAESELGKFSVPAIGDRAKVVNDTKITSIYFRETPDLIFTTWKNKDLYTDNSAYVTVLMNGTLENMFSISSQGQSAHDKLDELLYANSYCIESVTIQSVPVYYLQPNTRIFVEDKQSGINGEYIVSKISLPLTYNGTMSITATKAPTTLY